MNQFVELKTLFLIQHTVCERFQNKTSREVPNSGRSTGTSVCVCVCVCARARTHTHHTMKIYEDAEETSHTPNGDEWSVSGFD
jgi:hypothetical protein